MYVSEFSIDEARPDSQDSLQLLIRAVPHALSYLMMGWLADRQSAAWGGRSALIKKHKTRIFFGVGKSAA